MPKGIALAFALVLAAAALIACKKKEPEAYFDGTCTVSKLQADAGNTHVTLAFEPKPGAPAKPHGWLDVIVMNAPGPGTAKDPDSPVHCSMHVAIDDRSFTAPGVAEVTIPTAADCAGDPPAGHYSDAKILFTPAALGGGKLIGCAYEGPVPKALGGRDQTVAAQLAALTPLVDAGVAAAVEARPIVRVEILDGLRFPDGVLHVAASPIEVYARVPTDWLASGALTPTAKAAVLAKMYGGPSWEKGNSDGSLYVVRSFTSRVLTPAEIAKPIWANATPKTWFYETLPDGKLDKRGPNFGPPVAPRPPESFRH